MVSQRSGTIFLYTNRIEVSLLYFRAESLCVWGILWYTL